MHGKFCGPKRLLLAALVVSAMATAETDSTAVTVYSARQIHFNVAAPRDAETVLHYRVRYSW